MKPVLVFSVISFVLVLALMVPGCVESLPVTPRSSNVTPCPSFCNDTAEAIGTALADHQKAIGGTQLFTQNSAFYLEMSINRF